MYRDILYEVKDPVATVTFNRPDRLNAWTERMGHEFRHALARAESDPAVVAVVLTGAGRGFCAGADMDTLSALSSGGAADQETVALEADPGDPELEAGFRGPFSFLMSLRKPVIAAVNGPCAGLALPLVLSCDLRFASDKASFLTAFARRGLIAEWAIAWLLPRVVGTGHALDLLLSARKIEAAEAARMNLVNRVVPHDELLEVAQGYARELAAHSSPGSMRVIKRQVYEALGSSVSTEHASSVQLMRDSFGTPDFAEGVAHFLERRPPRFKRL